METTIDYTSELNEVISLLEHQNQLSQEILDNQLHQDSILASINTLMLFIIFVLIYQSCKEKVTKWIR